MALLSHSRSTVALRLLVVLALLGALTGGIAATSPQMAAAAATGTGWSAEGPGVTEVSDGSTASPSFRYQTKSEGHWVFLRTATVAERVRLPWTWSGDHGRQRVRELLAVGFYRDGSFHRAEVLVDTGPRNLNVSGFKHGGTTHLDVQPGDVYGFQLQGGNRDSAGTLRGRLVLPPPPTVTVPQQPVTATTTDEDGAVVTFEVSAADEVDGPLPVTCTPASGSLFPVGDTQVTCSATSSSQQTTTEQFTVRVYFDQPHVVWPRAMVMGGADERSGRLRTLDEALWYRFPVLPDSVVEVNLTNLAANYDLALFGDIGQAFNEALSTEDLNRLTAEFAADAYSPSAYSPSAYSPSAYSPSAYSPSAYSPSAYSPSAYSPSAYSPSAYSPSAYSPSAYSPSAPLSSVFSPSAYSPSAYSEAELSQAYSSAQVRSLVAVSARDGLTDEQIRVNTWSATGYFYVRVQGRNGAFAPRAPFTLTTRSSSGACAEPMSALESVPTFRGSPGTARTVILTDSARLPDAPLDALEAFADRPEIDGVVVDAASIPRVQALHEQADRMTACPYAKNLVAQELREVVNSFRDTQDTVQYVVIAGDDAVVPFFRYADAAGLGPEQAYVPPVDDASSSQAALRRNQVLSQDAYGARFDVALKGARVPVPDLAVGRLVETPAEISAALDRYAALDGGVLPSRSALVTGYDFLTDAADAVSTELGEGLGEGHVDDLITDRDVPPSTVTVDVPDRRHSWTADDLRSAFLGERHDIVFLAGHFSANSALAADNQTSMLTRQVSNSDADLANALVLSVGCHSGYNIVDGHAIPGLTDQLDWAQLFAREGATFVGGTGYQYGDTDFLEYSERLYTQMTRELRTGNGPVAVGGALLRAKQDYLASTPTLSGIHQKSLLEATLYGLPMASVDLPGRRLADTSPGTVVPTPVTSGPGSVLGLQSHLVTAGSETELRTQSFKDVDGTGLSEFTYLTGPDGVSTGPGQPALPLEVIEAGAPGLALRGIGFRGGTYADTPGVVPLTGAPTTDTSEVHTRFTSPVFFPRRLALTNTFGAIEGDGGTRVLVTPAQYRSDSPVTSTLRRWTSVDLQLLYSGNTETYGANRPALAAPPAISSVVSEVDGDQVSVAVRVVGDPSAGIQEVWLTHTAEVGPWHGRWSSLDLVQDGDDSTLWTGSLSLPAGQAAGDVRFVIQAANGVGLVTMEDNQGREFIPGVDPADVGGGTAPASLTLDAPGSAVLGETLPVTARLTGDTALPGRTVRFSFGSATATAETDAQGVARASFTVVEQPGEQQVLATYDGDSTVRPVTSHRTVAVAKRPTQLALTSERSSVWMGEDTGVTARLTSGEKAVADRTILVVVRGADGQVVAAATRRTDLNGAAALGSLDLPAGTHTLRAFFGQEGIDVGDGNTAGQADPENAASASPPLVLEVADGAAPEVLTSSLPDAQAGRPYEAVLEVAGDPEPQVTVSGLPEGLSYADGVVSGVTTVAGTATVVIAATNRRGSVTRELALTVDPGAPATVAAIAGSGQAAPHGTGFAEPLVARVADAWSNPIPGVTVSFVAPATGPGTDPRVLLATTDHRGLASVQVTAGPDVGSYVVVGQTASTTTADPSTAAFDLTNRYRLSPFGAPFTADDGAQVELSASTAASLTVQVSDGHGRLDDVSALVMSLGCRVTLIDVPLEGGVGSSTCLQYDPVQGQFAGLVSGSVAGWQPGTVRLLRVEVLGDGGELLGRREVRVAVR